MKNFIFRDLRLDLVGYDLFLAGCGWLWVAVGEWTVYNYPFNCNSDKRSWKFAFIAFFYLRNQTQESGFNQIGGLLTRNISFFCLWWFALYFKVMPNSIDFYKGIFLDVKLASKLTSSIFFDREIRILGGVSTR